MIIVLIIISIATGSYATTGYFNVTDDYGSGGAKGDGQTNDSNAISEAIEAAGDSNLTNPTLYFPACDDSYFVTETISVPPGMSVIMDGVLEIDGDANEACLVIGRSDDGGNDDVSINCVYKLRARRAVQSNWTNDPNELNIGIKLINLCTCDVEIVEAKQFTIGVQCMGSGAGFVYNTLRLGYIMANKIALDLTNEDPDTDTAPFNNIGWCNENLFIGGRFGVYSSTQLGKSRYGVRMTSVDGSYKANNNNFFIKPCFELGASYSDPNEAVPILIEHGIRNRFESCRMEGNSSTEVRVENDSGNNEIDVGYGGTTFDSIDDQSQGKMTVVTNRSNRLFEAIPSKLIYDSGLLHKLAGYYDKNEKVHIPGCHVTYIYSSGVYIYDSDIIINPGYLELTGNRGIGGFVDTKKTKKFIFRRNTEAGHTGRLRIRCYDANDNILTSSGPNHPYVSTPMNNFQSTYFGGTYYQGSDSDGDIYFQVHDDVAKIAIMLTKGTNICQIRSFSLYTLDEGDAVWYPGYEYAGSPVSTPFSLANLAKEAPDDGTWKTGRIFYNAEPSGGEYVGWICISGGTPGTWKGFGAIEN
ncbi:MAG: glycosyl hydrolase family 28-related protein [Phycisphaerae bacterium]|jgi:hypothetical protein